MGIVASPPFDSSTSLLQAGSENESRRSMPRKDSSTAFDGAVVCTVHRGVIYRTLYSTPRHTHAFARVLVSASSKWDYRKLK